MIAINRITTESFVLGLLTGALFLSIGVFGLLRAKTIQQFGLNYYTRNQDALLCHWLVRYMATKKYLTVTRIIGLIASVVGVWLLFTVLHAYLNAKAE